MTQKGRLPVCKIYPDSPWRCRQTAQKGEIVERELLNKGPVLDKKGRPVPGFSRKSILTYDRRAIRAFPWRIKEWDFYQISNSHLCLQLTIGHAAYAGQVSLMLFDFQKGKKYLDICRTLALLSPSAPSICPQTPRPTIRSPICIGDFPTNTETAIFSWVLKPPADAAS